MAYAVRRPDSISTVQHAGDEHEAVRVTDVSGPVLPNEGAGRVGWTAAVAGHGGADDDGNKDASEDEEDAGCGEVGKGSVEETHSEAGHPGDD